MLSMKTMAFFNQSKKQDLNATKFFLACQEGDLDRVKKYIHQKRINIHQAVDEYGRTALHLASEYGHISIVRHLVHVGQMNVESKNDTGATALHFACRRNQLAMIQYLVGCDDNDDDDDDKTAATKNSKTQRLERCHANVRAVDDANHTALHFASYFGYIDIVRFLLSVWPNNIVAMGKEGHTPLHTAAEAGHLDIVMYFMEDFMKEYDADPNVITNDGYTPLHFACQKGHFDVVKYLIVSLPCHHPPVNMNVTTTDEYHYTPYDLAVKMNKTDVIEFMDLRRDLIHIYFGSIENGNYSSFLKCVTGSNDTNSKNGGSSTRKIHHKSGHLNYGIDVATTKQDNGNMALHVAAMHYRSSSTKHSSSSSDTKNGYIEIIHYIIHELQININTMNDDGWNALHLACAKGHIDLVRYFGDVLHVDYHHGGGGPITITNDTNGDTLLHLASRYGHLDIVQYFVAVCHVDISITNKQDQTPHEVACIASQDNIIEYYVQRQEIEDQFFEAAQQGDLDRMKECMKQDEYGIDVKSLNVNQSTVLHFACRYGHLHVVQYLTQHYDDSIIKINARNKDGCTPLHYASGYGHLPIVKYLIEEEGCHSYTNDMTNDGDTAYDLALSFQSYNVANYLSRISQHPEMMTHKEPVSRSLPSPQQPSRPSFRTATMPGTTDNEDGGTASSLDPEVLADRNRLENVMKDPTADPIIIGLKYLDFCTNQFTSKLLGEGAFGKVYLGYDHDLNNVQLAIKRIRFDALDETKINQIALSFRREISVLKRFRHPNIVIMYGYNVQLRQSSQFLVYEYLSNGSLNTFLMDEKGRTRLPSQIRLSIMFQITRSIHFLHTGGCDDLVIYHRDIKSGNICLTKDYTAKLIDCGLAKFVPDNRSAMTAGSISPTILNDSGAVAFGTPGYVCPIYSRGHVPFSAACDVFSLGVVFTELIVGCLQGGRSSRGTQNFGDYFSRYIRDDDDDIVEDGWQILMREADYAAEWNDDILELLCKLTVKCMAASPKRRYSTSDLVEELSKISSMNFACIPDVGSENDFPQVEELSRKMSLECTSDVHCVLCNRVTCTTVKCTDGHHTCVQCVEQEIHMQVGRSGEGIACKCGIVFHDDALYGKITSSIYHFYVQERVTQKVFDQNFSDIHKKLDTIATMTESNHDSIMTRLKSIDSKIQRVLGGLAYMATNSVQECPTLIWLVPAERSAGNSAKAWKQWTKELGQRRYDLYFICQHSFEVVDKKLGITVTRSWLVQAAPVLYLSLFFLRIALTIGGLPPLPFPIQKIARATQIAMNEDYVEDLLDDACTGSIEAFKTAYTHGTDLPYSESSKLLTSMSASYEGVVKKATSLRKCVWKQTMEPVVNHLGCIIWIKKEYRGLYVDD